MDTVDKMMNLTIEKAHDMWKAAINCLPAVDEVEKSRLDEALQLTLLMEKQENQNYKRKAPLQDIWKVGFFFLKCDSTQFIIVMHNYAEF